MLNTSVFKSGPLELLLLLVQIQSKQKKLTKTSYKGRSKIHQITFEQISRIHYDMYNFFRFTDPQNFSSRHYICV